VPRPSRSRSCTGLPVWSGSVKSGARSPTRTFFSFLTETGSIRLGQRVSMRGGAPRHPLALVHQQQERQGQHEARPEQQEQPFGILLIGKSASARLVSGTKMSPSPTPRKISGQKKSDMPLSVVKCACFHIDSAKIATPARIDNRPSNLPVKRPIVAIVNALASAPGRITNPVCSSVKF